ncbi:MAG: FAD-dependent oxidoreductase [Alphaproteobacteria bacterium]|nr:FAD-dependent oxidoreductase [Alphaproteobacteria bacterium]
MSGALVRSVVIVGAGPAGMAAAIAAVERNCRVTVLDEGARPGGQIYRQADDRLAATEFADVGEIERKHRLLDRFEAARRAIDYRPGVAVYAVFPNREIHFSFDGRTMVQRPDAIVLATGVRERAIPFPGWTTPGVMYAGGAQAILKAQQVLPGKRAVVAGCGPLPIVVAAQMLRAGGDIAALATLRSPLAMLNHPVGLWHGRQILGEGLRYARTIARAGVRRLTGYVPVRALGKDHLEAVVLAHADRDGAAVPGTEREIACDVLAVNYGFVSNVELAAMAGVRTVPAVGGGWTPQCDAAGRTNVDGIYVAGDCAGLRGALVAEAEGTIVGAAAADEGGDAAATARRRSALAFQSAVRATLHVPDRLWSLAQDDTIVCRCESVTLGELRGALHEGHHSLNAVKRNTRAGMGWCGGRTCLHAVAALAKLHAGIGPVEMMTPRPVVRPVTFAALASQTKVAAS